MNATRAVLSVCALAIATAPALDAICLIGGDTPDKRHPPPNGAPWKYVAQLDDASGTGVYLGSRFVITAGHVNPPQVVRIDGRDYAPDTAWGERRIGGDDLTLIRILGNPGLPRLKLIGPGDRAKNKKCTLIGWGQGNGEIVPGQGWKWSPPRVQRWGLNRTLPKYEELDGHLRIVTTFDLDAGDDEGAIANTDSGGALFQKFNGVWKLSGIAEDAESNGSFYDRDPDAPGRQPDRSCFARINEHRAAIKQIMASAKP